jgi:CBS domain-containing protein
MKSALVTDAVRNMDYDMYHFVYVLDDDFRLLAIYSESEVMDAMSRYDGIRNFEDLIVKLGGGQKFKNIG